MIQFIFATINLLIDWSNVFLLRRHDTIFLLVSGLSFPESQIISRRKSPALWREDLCKYDDDGDGSGKTKKDAAPGKKMTKRLLTNPPEVMAPVGGFPQLYAAIGNGADSVYLGLSAFSARARAANFDPDTELPIAVKAAHDARVKVYVALNTLVFDNELIEVENIIKKCIYADVDALIIQDLGVARLAQTMIKTLGSKMEVHASTQQTITSADGAAFCAELFDTTRVVLGRELSTQEIQTVSDQLEEQHSNVELEAFVHGALCVSYSGQCFSSEAWGGRSANRGQCAQACRMPYGLIDNGELKELGDFSYLLSPQDLCGLDHVPLLMESNVSCLKIEGRLKDEAYVAATTRAYRNAVDKSWGEYCLKRGIHPKMSKQQLLSSEVVVSRNELAQLFSRGQDEKHDGLSAGFFEGSKHQNLVRGRSPRHRGVHVGYVQEGSSWKRGLIVRLDKKSFELKLGDGIVIDRGLAQEEELGGAIFDIAIENDQAVVRFSKEVERKWRKYDDNVRKGHGSGKLLAPCGAHVWKSSDARIDKKMRRLSETPPPRSMVSIVILGSLGRPLQVIFEDGMGNIGKGVSDGCLVKAEGKGLTNESVAKAIGVLGNTRWTIWGEIDTSQLDADLWCPASWIKDARRHAVAELQSQVAAETYKCNVKSNRAVRLKSNDFVQSYINGMRKDAGWEASSRSMLSVLARNFDQVDALCRMVDAGERIDEIIVDFLEVDGMREAVVRTRQAEIHTTIATPRVIKPNESGIWRTLLRLEPDSLLVRSTSLLRRMIKLGGPGAIIGLQERDEKKEVKIPQLYGDFSLNVANALTAYELLEYGCSRVTASYDLGAQAVGDMLKILGPEYAARLEIVVHAHLPIFHTEHCVFARFLSNGNSYLDCGHVCTRHNIHLRDETGKDNLVLADMGCRNTVFAAEAQSGAHSLDDWTSVGARHFRVELVDESAVDAQKIVRGYRSVMEGEIRANELWEILESVQDRNGRKGGVSFGSFRNTAERRAGEITQKHCTRTYVQ